MKKSLLLIGFIGLLTSCTVIRPSYNNPSTSYNNHTSFDDIDDDTITDEEKEYPTEIDDLFDYYEITTENYDSSKYYYNSLSIQIPQMPDPFALTVEEDGEEVYYVYGTTDRTASRSFDCYRTKNFKDYELYREIDINSENNNIWCHHDNQSKFAPEVYYINGTYYLYYSANDSTGKRYISVMSSDSPTGPFVECGSKNKPCFDHVSAGKDASYGVLDQTVLVDDDGSLYMYYSVYKTGSEQNIVGIKLTNPTTPDWSTYKELARPGRRTPSSSVELTWEANHRTGFNVTEGPFMLKSPVDGKYYLTYSANHYTDRYYTVCYAVSDSPLGNFVKPYTPGGDWTNVLFGYAGPTSGEVYNQWEGFMSGTGHHAFFKSGDQYMIVYHAHADRSNSTLSSSVTRRVAIDYIFFDDEGVPFSRGPTSSIQPLPEAISGYKNIAPLAKLNAENVTNPERLVDNFVVEHYNLSQEANREAKVNAGKAYLEFVFPKTYAVSGMLIYNSAYYDKIMTDPISFINFGNGNAILDGKYNYDEQVNDSKRFVYPCSAYVFDIAEIDTDHIVIEFDSSKTCYLNEILILGYEI